VQPLRNRLMVAYWVMRYGVREALRRLFKAMGKSAGSEESRHGIVAVLEGDITSLLLQEVLGFSKERAVEIAGAVTAYLGYLVGWSEIKKEKEELSTGLYA